MYKVMLYLFVQMYTHSYSIDIYAEKPVFIYGFMLCETAVLISVNIYIEIESEA